jgi:GntR family transcriptional regulator
VITPDDVRGPIRRIDTSSALPYYAQLYAILKARITGGEWPAGHRLPSEPELCELYDVSRITVRQALALLVRDGNITRGRGKGTFVRDTRLTAAPRTVSSFSSELHDLGMKPGSRILDVRRSAATADLAEKMGLEPGAALVAVRRLRLADDRPIGIQTATLPAARFPGLEGLLGDDVSLYTILREYFGVVGTGATEVFKGSTVGRASAGLLECTPSTPAFDVTRISFDNEGVYEHTASLLRGDRYEIRIALTSARTEGN